MYCGTEINNDVNMHLSYNELLIFDRIKNVCILILLQIFIKYTFFPHQHYVIKVENSLV